MTSAQAASIATGDTVDIRPYSGRLMSLDIFRGLAVAGMILVDNPGSDEHAYWAIKHAEWNGWTPADFIFPSFLFLVGVSMVFSFSARLGRGESKSQIFRHVLVRTLILIAVGLFVNGFPLFQISTLRFEGVTQRIGLCYFVAAVLLLWSDRRGQIVALISCLIGYWVLLRFVPVPGSGLPGRDIPFMDPERNLPAWLDRKLFMGHLYDGTRDPEGLLHTIPAIATTLIGVLTGHWLRTNRSARTKLAQMLLWGILGLVAGQMWNIWFPINKNLWTSSFVLFSGGFSLLLLSVLFWIVEIKHWRGGWTIPILVFGMNAIAGFVADSFVYGPAYSLQVHRADGSTMSWLQAANAFFLSIAPNPVIASLLYSLCAVLFAWTLLWLLWRKRIFIKI